MEQITIDRNNDYNSHHIVARNQISLTYSFLEAVRAELNEHGANEMIIEGVDGAQAGLCAALESVNALFEIIEADYQDKRLALVK